VTDNIGAGSYLVDIAEPTQAIYQTSLFTPTGTSFNLTGKDTSFSVTIDGVSSGPLSILAQNYTGGGTLAKGQSVAAAIEASINGAIAGSTTVSFEESTTSPGQFSFKIMSNSTGSTSSVVFVPSADMLAQLNIADNSGSAATGKDRTATIGGEPAIFDGDRLTGTGLYAGFVLDIINGGTGSRTIQVGEGNVSKLDSLINSFLDGDGLLDAKVSGLSASIEAINDQRASLALRLESLETRLVKQFSAMDSLVARLNSTSSFLTNQLEQVSNIGKK